ncbi:MAG: peptidase [Eubacterium sp.]|nr:peptidase [Eubacterium sp.]
MISDFLYNILKIIKSRIFIVMLLIVAIFATLIIRIFDLQIVNENYYMSTYIQKAEKTVYSPGTRGNIYDCKGNLLAYDTLAYVATFEDTIESDDNKNKKLNKIADKAIKIIEKCGDKIVIDFPIVKDRNGNLKYNFTSESQKKLFVRNLFGEDPVRDGVDYSLATPPQMFYYLKNDLFKIPDYEDFNMLLKVMSIRYNVYLNSYQKYVSVVISKNISNETMVAINENKAEIPGVGVEERNIRRYKDSVYFAPIIGYTGTISTEELEEKNEKGGDYVASDIIGKAGIESAEEKDLQGKRGEKKIFVDSTGKILSTISNKDSTAGNDVYLSIDSKLQKASYKLLEKKIASILLSEIVNHDVPKKDEDSDDDEINLIPASKVISQLVTNNVVSIPEINAKSSKNEKEFYKEYEQSLERVLKKLEKQLRNSHSPNYNKLNEEYQDYNDYIYDMLKNNGVLLTSSIDTENEVYQKYIAGKTTTNKFLHEAIRQNWINVEALKVNQEYLSTGETYDTIVEYIIDTFESDSTFDKKVVQYRVADNTINPCEVLLLLYDQNVFEMNKHQYHSLQRHDSYVAYRFIKTQIKNLKITPAQIALDPCSGSVVVTDPNNGQVKAMVTYPSYDNNMLSGSVDPDYWAKLVDDQSDPLYNRSTQGVTAPGSTFKMCTSFTALENDKVSTTETVNDKGKFKKIKPSPKCWAYPHVHGKINIVDAIAESCNYFFYEMGYRLGKVNGKYDSTVGLDKIEKYATKLGLNMKSGVEITESKPHFSTESSVHSAIGQGSHAYAPVQLSRYISTLANGGTNYKLSLINKIASSNGKTVSKNKAVSKNKVGGQLSTWNAVTSGMRKVVTEGTVKKYFKGTKIKIAGKSGTAQENKRRNSHALFVAYAPYNKPKYTCTAVIPYGNSSHDSAELAKYVLQYIYGELDNKDINKRVKSESTSGGVQD